ncbi:BadF-type ATPase [Bryocella elongata]|uniref:BadF-type ATPase n=2 Tax=Bryocella elongata TaxID=863522 RepID=A0A1H5SI18_9BACT|nr:BadF-type ATPase [Bryocella elongata]
MGMYLGLDAGGTGTRCWVADETQVLGCASIGTVKIMAVGEEVATERLKRVITEAAKKANVPLDSITRTCIGLAGNSSHAVCQWAERTIASVASGEIIILGDEEIALEAAFQGGPGMLVIAGSGSNVMGRCSDGTRVTAGGYGPMVGDEGSGGWIGIEALRAGLRARDRGVSTCVLREIEDFWELDDLGELVARANQRLRPDFSELCMVVATCADGGDALAISVLERAGEELASQVSLVISKMKALSTCKVQDFSQLAFTGNVLGKIPRVRRSMEAHLSAMMPELKFADKPVEPLEGAVWRARKG